MAYPQRFMIGLTGSCCYPGEQPNELRESNTVPRVQLCLGMPATVMIPTS